MKLKKLNHSERYLLDSLDKKVKRLERHYHEVNQSIEKLLKEPTEENIKRAIVLVNYQDSFSYRFFPSWSQNLNFEEIEHSITDSSRFLIF
ncbi:hypothetical protein [Enterococcus sp. AZ103]|uniref:hypothetical protein n=1 Tax=Enterococcus sp. AZ103 TaxID=2774628 RepID=UPI003F218F6B